MSVLLSLAAPQPEPQRNDEMMYVMPTPLSGLIAAVFGEGKSLSPRAVLFTAAQPGAGVSWMASAVAAELAASGRKVLLAEAGVIASLPEDEDAVALCDRVGTNRIWVLGQEQKRRARLPRGTVRGQVSSVLASLLVEFPHIVVDAPALSKSDVALQLAPYVAGSILVVRKAMTEARMITKACELLTALGGKIFGSLYNDH